MTTSVPPRPTPFEPSTKPFVPVPALLPQVRAPRAMLATALGVGGLAAVLLDRPLWGVSFPLVVLALLGALLAVGGREGWQQARPNAWLTVPLVLVSGFVAVRSSPWLVLLNVLTAGVLLLLLTHFWAAGRVQRLGLLGYPLVALGSLLKSLLYPPAVARDSLDLEAAKAQAPKLMPFARGLLIALPVLGVFGLLLTSADAAFASAMERVWAVDVWGLMGISPARIFWALVAAWGAAMVLGHALRRHGMTRELGEDEVTPAKPRLGLTEALTLVLAVDALFLVFAGFQVAYLFIGGAASPAPGYSFAEYARRGFFELLVVSLLTLVLVMALARWTRRETPAARVAFQVGTSLMVALTLVILASAVKRMVLYEDAFGYTRLRVFTHVFMYALGAVLTWRAVTLWWRPERFAIGAFVSALGAVVAVNAINPDALIVRLNLARAQDASSIDYIYLVGLSSDAVPELARGLKERAPETLDTMLAPYARMQQESSWPEWNLARARARRALAEVQVPAP
jgi:hypothetical protein